MTLPCERWLWRSAEGITRELTAFVNGTEVSKGIQNRYAPPVVINRSVVPGRAGATTTTRRHDWRPLPFPLWAVGANVTALQDLLANLARDMDPADGNGTLIYIGLDGRRSELFCVQTKPLDAVLWIGSRGQAGQQCALQFEADDPYFYRDEQNPVWRASDPSDWFGIGTDGNWVPISLGSGSILGAIEFDTESDAETWPVWTVVGGSDPVFQNDDTGEIFSFSGVTLGPGEPMVIDLREGVKTITGPAGQNYFDRLTPSQRQLWPLRKGIAHFTLSVSAADSGSYIGLYHRPRTLAP